MAFANENILSGHGPDVTPITVPQGGSPVKQFVLVDPTTPDSPVNALTLLGEQDDATYATWAASGGSVVVTCKELWSDVQNTFTANASAVTPAEGTFKFRVPAAGTREPGIFLLEYGLYSKDDALVLVNHTQLEIQPSLTASNTYGAILSVSNIRRMIRDLHPRANRVLEECEFSLSEIQTAIQTAMDWFMSEPPLIRVNFSIKTFPYPIRLAKGAIAELLMMASLWYERNNLHLSGAGLTIDDMSKSDWYAKMAQMHKQEYIDWVKVTKRQMNVANGWGHLGSQMYNGTRGRF